MDTNVATNTYKLISSLIEKVSYLPREDIEKIKETAYYIVDKHEGQFRKSGEPYHTHPIEVAKIVAGLKLDTASIISALLHDIVEDTDTPLEEIKEKFGEEIAFIVDGLTKISKHNFNSKEEAEAENFRKMLVAMGKDFRVILVKLADRLHNMRTLDALRPEKQRRIANETLKIYAPIASRIGLWKIKSELEDLAFKYLYPEEYKKIVDFIAHSKEEQEKFLKEIIEDVKEELKKHNIKATIQYRVKHLYSIYEKLFRKNLTLSQVYDIYGIRILVEDVSQCYLTLGLIHQLWRPIEGRIKDYIANPKPNNYQALHTSVITEKGKIVEFQIKTYKMHEIAEKGIAAHFRYKGGKYLTDKDLEIFKWLWVVLESIRNSEDTETLKDLKENLNKELTTEEIYVLTPKGDIIKLPLDATPVDFAYKIHTEVGHRTVGAKVNGQIVPLDTKLKTGDVVEIRTSKKPNPKKDWLRFIKTSKARTNIRQFLSKLAKEENFNLGKKLLDKFLRKIDKQFQDLTEEEKEKLVKKFSFKNFEDLVASIGAGKLSPTKVVSSLMDEPTKRISTTKATTSSNKDICIEVDGISNIMLNIAKCCMPIPGEDIVGIVVKGKGISIHNRDCPNIQKILNEEPERILPSKWSDKKLKTFPVKLRIITDDKPGILANISSTIANQKVNITGINSKSTSLKTAIINLQIEVYDINQLNKIINSLKGLKGIRKVERIRLRNI